jgi:hypothetical protein
MALHQLPRRGQDSDAALPEMIPLIRRTVPQDDQQDGGGQNRHQRDQIKKVTRSSGCW